MSSKFKDILITPIKNRYKNPNARNVRKYVNAYKQETVVPQTVLYESRDGEALSDSPFAIFLYLLNHPDYANYQHVWSIVPSEEMSTLMAEFNNYPNVTFIERNSDIYLRWLAKAEFLINNSTLQSFFIRKDNQVYLNTWHGTPLKTMGFDIPGSPSQNQNVLRNFLQTNYLLTPNPHTTAIFQDSYRLKGIYEGAILESGYPRIDLTLNTPRTQVDELYARYNLNFEAEKETILYCPTWKGSDLQKANNDMNQIIKEIKQLRAEHGARYNLLVKVHPYLYKTAVEYDEILPYLIPNVVDTNQVLGATDILITDYSSIFFDYLVTDKPILFYLWDNDIYDEDRGNYLEYEDLPGEICYTVEELSQALTNIGTVDQRTKEKYASFKKQFVPYDDGKVTERIVNHVFNGQNSQLALGQVIKPTTEKESILIYPGGMMNNGITTSAINLINNIDHEKYKVICFLGSSNAKEVVKNIGLLAPEVHLIFRFSYGGYSVLEDIRDKFVHYFGASGLSAKVYPRKAYERDMKRLLANVRIDNAIDFSGYSLHWSKNILAAPSKEKIIFLHNDLKSDSERVVNGTQPHKLNLEGVFSVYKWFDKLLSVSEATMKVNYKNLAQYAPKEKFGYSVNTINPAKILGNAAVEQQVEAPYELVKEDKSAVLKQQPTYTIWNKNPFEPSAVKTEKEIPVHDLTKGQVIAQVSDGSQSYCKLLIDDIYLGWIATEMLTLSVEIRFDTKGIKHSQGLFYGKIATGRMSRIYAEAFNFNKVVSNGRYLRNIYLSFNKVAEYQRQKQYEIVINDQVIGWLNESDIRPSRFLNRRSNQFEKFLFGTVLRKIVFRVNNRRNTELIANIDQRPLALESVKAYGKVESNFAKTEKINVIFPKVLLPKKIEKSLPKQAYIWLDSKVTTHEGAFYSVVTHDEQRFWVSCSAITEIAETEEVVVKREAIDFTVAFVAKSPLTVYQGDFTPKELTTDISGYFNAIEKITSNHHDYFMVMIEGEGYQVLAKDIRLSQSHGTLNTNDEYIEFPKETEFNFVNMGRLSPEKDQQKLIKAFAKFKAQEKVGKLYILGSGGLEEELVALIEELALTKDVFLVGQLESPFRFIEKCDAFVLSSLYEGQPMVLLESLTLGVPIISTDIPSCRYVLEDGKYGLITEKNDVDGLFAAMVKMYREKPTFTTFDYASYNEHAVSEFYRNLA